MADDETEPHGPVLESLRKRKLVQWTAGYAAGAWVLLQVLSLVGQQFDWSPALLRVVTITLGLGFFVTLVVAWFHGERGQQRVTPAEIGLLALLTLAGGALLWRTLRLPEASPPASASSVATPPAPATATGEAIPEIDTDPSIAVLPLVNMSSDKEQDYFSDGISEELLNLLAKVPKLRVIARTSSFSFKGKDTPLLDIARQLHVAAVLEGSVRKAGDKVRITVQLIRARDSTHLWSETYDRTLDDIFRVQDEIAGDVVRRLQVSLMGAQPTVRATRGDAFDAYLQASQLSRQHTTESLARATDLYQRAIDLDPRYAPAYVGLAFNALQINDIGLLSNAEAWARARKAAGQALSVDPNNAVAHAVLAYVDMTSDLAGAARHLTEAAARGPNDPLVQIGICTLLSVLGRTDEAVGLSLAAVRRDPLSPEVHEQLGYHLLRAHRPVEAASALEHALDISPGFDVARAELAEALSFSDPARAYEQVERISSDIRRLLGRAMIGPKVGRQREADAALEELTRRYETDWSYNIAYAYAVRNEADPVFVWLEKARQHNDTGLAGIVSNPKFDPIRADPRWLPFLRKIGRDPETLAKIEFNVALQ